MRERKIGKTAMLVKSIESVDMIGGTFRHQGETRVALENTSVFAESRGERGEKSISWKTDLACAAAAEEEITSRCSTQHARCFSFAFFRVIDRERG